MKVLFVFVLIAMTSNSFAQDAKATDEKIKASAKKIGEKVKDTAEDVVDIVKQEFKDYNWNIKTNPVSLLIGATNAEINYALFRKLSLGFGALRWSTTILDVEFTATEYHVRTDFWFNDTFKQGWYIGAQISRLGMDLTTEVSGVDFTGSINSTGYLGQFGYHWQWDNFNIDFGTYFGYYDFDPSIKLEDASGNIKNESIPAFGAVGAEFFMGWAF